MVNGPLSGVAEMKNLLKKISQKNRITRVEKVNIKLPNTWYKWYQRDKLLFEELVGFWMIFPFS